MLPSVAAAVSCYSHVCSPWLPWSAFALPTGDPALGTPIISSNPAALQEAPSAQIVINTAELQDYLACQGAWALDPAPTTQPAAGAASGASRPATPAPAAGQASKPQGHTALGEAVAELAHLAQKLRPKLAAAQVTKEQTQHGQEPVSVATTDGDQESLEAEAEAAPVESAAEAAAGTGAAPGADVIHSMPLKLAVVRLACAARFLMKADGLVRTCRSWLAAPWKGFA